MEAWYLKIMENGLSPYREAHGPFDSPADAGAYINASLEKWLAIIQPSDLEIYDFFIVYDEEQVVREWTENQEILEPTDKE